MKKTSEIKVALITGASSGIGLELAKCLAKRYYSLVLVARRKTLLQKIKSDLEKTFGVEVFIITSDLTTETGVSDIVSEIKHKGLKIHTLINNAGVGGHGLFYKRSKQSNLSIIDLNIRALTELTYELLPCMIEKKDGRILNIASTAGMLPGPLQSVYYASKAYVLSFSQALSEELKMFGITVTAFCPGATETEFATSGDLNQTRLFQGKLHKPEQVAVQALKAMDKNCLVAASEPIQMFQLRYLIPFLPRKLMLKISRSYMEERS